MVLIIDLSYERFLWSYLVTDILNPSQRSESAFEKYWMILNTIPFLLTFDRPLVIFSTNLVFSGSLIIRYKSPLGMKSLSSGCDFHG
jgi:hypothetical protein